MSPSAPKILVPRILVPRSWHQDPGTKILVPRSWYQDLWGNQSGTLERPPRGGGVPQRLSSWGQSLRRVADRVFCKRILRDCPREDKRWEWGGQSFTLDPPRTLSQRLSSWGQTLRDPPRGGGGPQRIKSWWNPYTPSRTRFSNGLAYNRSKVSVKKSQIGFVVINFSRSIFPYMSNIYENG